MNLDSLTAALSHIGNLVASLTKKNLNSSVQEIQEVSVQCEVCVLGGNEVLVSIYFLYIYIYIFVFSVGGDVLLLGRVPKKKKKSRLI